MSAARPLPRERERITAKGVLCQQCWNRRDRSLFRTNEKTGQPFTQCDLCRDKYKGWEKLSDDAKLAKARAFESDDAYSVHFVAVSHNRKLGEIPATMTARGSCPESCSFKNAGCFAEQHFQRVHWARVPTSGLSWDAFCREVAKLTKGQLWRHNEAGDLPGRGEAIDPIALSKLVVANRGKRGFTFTHKPLLESKGVSRHSRSIPSAQERALWIVSNRRVIARAVRAGFVINLSADSLDQADELAALGIAPVSVVVPADAPSHATKTPGGRQVVVCPNETHGLTCSACQLCAVGDRKSIVAFRAHGQSKAIVSEIVRGKRDGRGEAKAGMGGAGSGARAGSAPLRDGGAARRPPRHEAREAAAVAPRATAGHLPRVPAAPDDHRGRSGVAAGRRGSPARGVRPVRVETAAEQRAAAAIAAARDRVAALLARGRAAAAGVGGSGGDAGGDDGRTTR
jgi:hypothetical protein